MAPQMNPIWKMANRLKLKSYFSDYTNLSSNTYKQNGGVYGSSQVEEAIEVAEKMNTAAEKLSKSLNPSGQDDISVLTSQRLQNHVNTCCVPSTPLDMVVDYYSYDYEFAEPPRVTSLQNIVPLPTFANFGEDVYFVADQRGYASIVYDLATQFLKTNKNGSIVDRRLRFGKVVRHIKYTGKGVTVVTEDGSSYKADYFMRHIKYFTF